MPRKSAKQFKRGIWIYEDKGETFAMNYSSIGECLRRDGVQPVSEFMRAQPSITREERGNGHARGFVCVVTDRAALETSMAAAGIKLIP